MLLVAEHKRHGLLAPRRSEFRPPATRRRAHDIVTGRTQVAHEPHEIARLPHVDHLQPALRHPMRRVGGLRRIGMIRYHNSRHAEKGRGPRDPNFQHPDPREEGPEGQGGGGDYRGDGGGRRRRRGGRGRFRGEGGDRGDRGGPRPEGQQGGGAI